MPIIDDKQKSIQPPNLLPLATKDVRARQYKLLLKANEIIKQREAKVYNKDMEKFKKLEEIANKLDKLSLNLNAANNTKLSEGLFEKIAKFIEQASDINKNSIKASQKKRQREEEPLPDFTDKIPRIKRCLI